jgi:hypothetical protein
VVAGLVIVGAQRVHVQVHDFGAVSGFDIAALDLL